MNNKNTKHLIALGYPMGILPTDDEAHYKIDFRDEVYGIGGLEYIVWQLAFAMENTEEAKRKFIQLTRKSEDTFFEVGEKLMKNKFIIEVNLMNLHNEINKLYDFSFVRQGVGRGLFVDKNRKEKYTVINLNKEIELSFIEYLLWTRGNGSTKIYKMIKEIMDNYKEESDREDILETICRALLILYKNNLIVFKG